MSKVDALRALREARQSATAPTVPADPADGVCGHRNMSGRGCTRPAGHAETSHRYAPKA